MPDDCIGKGDEQLSAVVNHVFLPPKLPQQDDEGIGDSAMCRFSHDAARDYLQSLPPDRQTRWSSIPRMLENLCLFTEHLSMEQLQTSITGMRHGDILAFYIRAQNAAIIMQKSAHETVYKVFEASPTTAVVMAASGKLIWSFPGPAVKVPREASEDPAFIEELASFLLHMDADALDSGATTTKAGSKVKEVRDTAHPRYISELLIGILRGWGSAADVPHITKRIADDVIWKDAYKPWRRSPLWLIIRVTIQTSVESEYKNFMLFLHARLLKLCCKRNFASELLFCMRAKTIRRLCKLGRDTLGFILQMVERSQLETEAILQKRWKAVKEIQSGSLVPVSTDIDIDITDDTILSLPHSCKYLSSVMQTRGSERFDSSFRPEHHQRLHDFGQLNTDLFSRALQTDTFIALADFEDLVGSHLEEWTVEHMNDTSAAEVIASCFDLYFHTATSQYSCVDDYSVMILTLMELWVALDKLAIAQLPLLKDYSPEIPPTFLEPLLLRHARLLKRAAILTTYLRRRHGTLNMAESIFSNKPTTNSLSIRYFAQSQSLRSIKEDIEQVATSRREAKIAELHAKNTEWETLNKQAVLLKHTCCSPWSGRRQWYCDKCNLESRAGSISISIHEWPLPADQSEAERVVFELQCPPIVQIWRRITYAMLMDMSMPTKPHGVVPFEVLYHYKELHRWAKIGEETRLTLASITTSFTKAHYKEASIPASKADVCVNNGLNWKLYDLQQQAWAEGASAEFDSLHYCVLQLPPNGPYNNLQKFVTGVGHTSNEVIAMQAKCSLELSLHEFIAFGVLRSGPRIQWMNIARELRANSLTFSREEVHVLIMQAAWQLGPLLSDGSSAPRYDWHIDLVQSRFGNTIIGEMENVLARVESNWLEGVTAKTIVLLASRLLASASDIGVCEHAYSLLRRARGITFRWMRTLINKLQASNEEEEVEEMQLRACEMAAICRITYDVDEIHLHSLLDSTSDFAILFECAIVVHDNKPAKLDDVAPGINMLLRRDQRLSRRLEKIVASKIGSNSQGLNDAISSVWPSYRRGKTGWRALEPPNSRWVESSTLPDTSQGAQHVHLNILEGCLLVDGKPLGRLPRNIVTHRTYIRIFGTKVLDVIPADLPGMDFATRASILGWQVSFSMKENGNNLIISARQNGGPILELVPHYKLSGDFPVPFVDNYTHWFSLSTGELEFRPLESLWQSSSSNWRLHFSIERPSRMIRYTATESCQLVDIHSTKFARIYEWIAPVERAEYVTVVHKMQEVSIDLPRFRLGFHLTTEGALESQNFPGMIIDVNQSAGTMFGLRNQLVLCPKDVIVCSLPRSRHVLIPQGKPTVKRHRDHVTVDIDIGHMPHVSYHIYKIDTDLGYLVGTGSLHSRLYKIYLHALCSHCLPDTLTGRTGTEEALHELCSAGCLSFRTLEPAEAEILRLINSLTPRRMYYPAHLKVMQSVKWSNDLPFLSQHDGLHPATQAILEYANKLDIFNDGSQLDNIVPDVSTSNQFLMKRAACRNSIFFPFDFATISTPNDTMGDLANDSEYSSRDMGDSGGKAKELEVFEISRMTKTWPDMLNVQRNLLKTLESWDHIAGQDTCVSLSYNKDWLKPDLSQQWLGLYNLCRQSSNHRQTQLRLTFSLAAMTYGSSEQTDRDLVSTILSFATVDEFEKFDPPIYKDYCLSDGVEPDKCRVSRMVQLASLALDNTPAAKLSKATNEDEHTFFERQSAYYERKQKSYICMVVDGLMAQWSQNPSGTLQEWRFSSWRDWIDISKCITDVNELFQSCYRNRRFHLHMSQVENVLRAHWVAFHSTSGVSPYSGAVTPHRASSSAVPYYTATIHQLLSGITPTPSTGYSNSVLSTSRLSNEARYNLSSAPPNLAQLGSLFAEFRNNQASLLHRRYGEDLEASRKTLQKNDILGEVLNPNVFDNLIDYRNRCKEIVVNYLAAIRSLLSPSDQYEGFLRDAGLGPRIIPRVILGLLAFEHIIQLSNEWKKTLITYAYAFMQYQRAQRLLRFKLDNKSEDFMKEWDNNCFSGEDTETYPDWALIQIEGDFLARQIQTRVAHEMIQPESGENTVLQLNMGEGKSSVIVPLVAAALADGTELARVVVLKSLVGQMFQTLSDRLCGLPNRRIFYMPFSRNVKLTADIAKRIQNLYQECLREGGILIAQPEHLLSYKLMGVDRALSCNGSSINTVANQLRESQRWLDAKSRDILDESDEILHVRYQMIYTMGEQKPVEDHPDRWTTVQQVLTLVKDQTAALYTRFQKEIIFNSETAGTFPTIRILSENAVSTLVSSIAERALKGALPNLSITFLPKSLHDVAIRFITNMDNRPEDYSLLKDTGHWKSFLLLRGLLAHGILVYALKERRWRVDYGLDLNRSLLAVPFRAKDMPSLRAEFGHPDVAIVLTCLSYYYGGLTEQQLRQCFNLLFKLDNPVLEYEKWVQDRTGIPVVLQQLAGVNIRDNRQFHDEIMPLFRRRHIVVDFFLSQVVFPKAAKEFPKKIGTSGWDIAESKTHVTTGFSGTNDNRYLLPTSISQRDPVQQSSTNALVLSILLAPENEKYVCISPSDVPHTVTSFLKLLNDQKPEIRVLLDVGAQMLEMNNKQLVECWLKMKPSAAAAIFFDDSDNLCVLTQEGTVEAFRSSPYHQQLEKCIIYLDDAHTRGTDLKLPRDFRAAVTLGPKVTKDRLLQGCMRMRQLGKGQSVMFFAPGEIDARIKKSRPRNGKPSNNEVSVLDVLRWTMMETCDDIQRHIPQWIQQGVDYDRRRTANDGFRDTGSSIDELKSAWLQPESRSLEEMYQTTSAEDSTLRSAASKIPAIEDRLKVILGNATLSDTRMHEEQEREVAYEIERERQVERPLEMTPLKHKAHQHIRDFIRTGNIPTKSTAFLPLLQPLSFPSGRIRAIREPWSPLLLATKDFVETVQGLTQPKLSDYMRSVNWVVSSVQSGAMTLVVMSPYEVNEFLPEIRKSTRVHLHQYAPRVTHFMETLEDLNFYCVPALPEGWTPPPLRIQMQLNLWAGQLYLQSYDVYEQLCTFLGVVHSEDSARNFTVQSDGFVKPEHRSGQLLQECPFEESPLPALKEIIGLRRKGMRYISTQIGKILHARLLSPEDFVEANDHDRDIEGM